MKPWQVKSWVSGEAGPDLVCGMEEVLEVYEQPYEAEQAVVCLDESPKPLIGERRESFTDEPGIEPVDSEYTPEGTVDLYLVVEPLAGKREVLVKNQQPRLDGAEVVAQVVEERYPTAKKITLVQDNLSAHKNSAFEERLEPKRAGAIVEQLDGVFTPKPGSWLNLAEIELRVLTRQGLNQRVASKEELEWQVTAWYEKRKGKRSQVDWQFTTKEARINLKRLYTSIKP